MTHRIELRVYYEDTDLAGIVYYANYLKFIERGRTEWVRSLGVNQGALRAETGIVFAVKRLEADFVSPARFDDVLTVETSATSVSGAKVEVAQRVLRDGELLFAADVTLAALTETGRPARLPAEFRARLNAS